MRLQCDPLRHLLLRDLEAQPQGSSGGGGGFILCLQPLPCEQAAVGAALSLKVWMGPDG